MEHFLEKLFRADIFHIHFQGCRTPGRKCQLNSTLSLGFALDAVVDECDETGGYDNTKNMVVNIYLIVAV